MLRSDSRGDYVQGFEIQIRHPDYRIGRLPGGNRKDWFAEGQLAAKKCFDMVDDFQRLYRDGPKAQARLMEFYDRVGISPPYEPCLRCNMILFCRVTGMTCPAFRGYVSGKYEKPVKLPVMIPDRRWDDSFKDDDEPPGPKKKCQN